MKNILIFLFLLTGWIAQAQKPVKNAFLRTRISHDSLFDVYTSGDSLRATGIVRPDNDQNYILGANIQINGNSVGNLIHANDVVCVNSSNNNLLAENVQIRNASGVTAIGADHIIGDTVLHPYANGADYSYVSGDANTECGYGSRTSGVGNKNFVYNGVCDGELNVLGRVGYCNYYRNSAIKGNNNTLEGNNSFIIGSWIKVTCDNVIVIGNATPGQPAIFGLFTPPGVYLINQQGLVTKVNNSTEGIFHQQMLLLFHMNGQPANEYLIAKPIKAY